MRLNSSHFYGLYLALSPQYYRLNLIQSEPAWPRSSVDHSVVDKVPRHEVHAWRLNVCKSLFENTHKNKAGEELCCLLTDNIISCGNSVIPPPKLISSHSKSFMSPELMPFSKSKTPNRPKSSRSTPNTGVHKMMKSTKDRTGYGLCWVVWESSVGEKSSARRPNPTKQSNCPMCNIVMVAKLAGGLSPFKRFHKNCWPTGR